MKRTILAVFLLLAAGTLMCLQSGSARATQDSGKTNAKACACCTDDRPADATEGTCTDCCKNGKCPMINGSNGAKCPMMTKAAKTTKSSSGCCGEKCPMHAKDAKGHGCCCGDVG